MTPAQEQMYAFWREWFAQPVEEKARYLRSPGKGGYYPPFSEAPGYDVKADPKEYFHYRWPNHEEAFDDATRAVFWECFDTAEAWLHQNGFSSLARVCQPRDCVLRIIRYPATEDGAVGQAHCDYNLLTVSVPSSVPGLEVWDNGEWIPRETYEVHTGEMLTHYAKFPATPHRVQTPPNTERFKAVFFYLPPNDFKLKADLTAAAYLKEVMTKAGTYALGAK